MASITSWTRLEPRARGNDMRPSLEARVHDPLWLLGRQWQVGEFQGEDTGTPVQARVRATSATLSRQHFGELSATNNTSWRYAPSRLSTPPPWTAMPRGRRMWRPPRRGFR